MNKTAVKGWVNNTKLTLVAREAELHPTLFILTKGAELPTPLLLIVFIKSPVVSGTSDENDDIDPRYPNINKENASRLYSHPGQSVEASRYYSGEIPNQSSIQYDGQEYKGVDADAATYSDATRQNWDRSRHMYEMKSTGILKASNFF